MTNETYFFLRVILDAFFVLLLLRLGKAGLFVAIVTNLLLISVFGGKLVELFGSVTNTGNAFYVMVFLATNLLVEHYGKKEAYRSIMVGFSALVLFVIMSQITILMSGQPETATIATAMQTLWQGIPRIAFASILAYLVAQTIDIWIYDTMKRNNTKGPLWVRNLVAVIAGQGVDSVIFFLIAFAGTVSGTFVIRAILTGFVLKVFAALLTTPVLYWSRAMKKPTT